MNASTGLVAVSFAIAGLDFGTNLIELSKVSEVIPDVFPTTFQPSVDLAVTYTMIAETGLVIPPEYGAKMPRVYYKADPSKFYTLALVDAGDQGIPNRSNDLTRTWLVVNIPGNDVAKGNSTATPYRGLTIPECGYRRHVFALVEQSRMMPGLTVPASREKFDMLGYFSNNNMTLVGGNFFLTASDVEKRCPGAAAPSYYGQALTHTSDWMAAGSSGKHAPGLALPLAVVFAIAAVGTLSYL